VPAPRDSHDRKSTEDTSQPTKKTERKNPDKGVFFSSFSFFNGRKGSTTVKDMMNKKRIVLLTMVVAALGIVALPSTISLFSGQHTWYDVSYVDFTSHTTVPCKKCHADVYEEMATHIGPHTESGIPGLRVPMYCEDCHRVFYNYSAGGTYPKYTYARGLGASSTPGKEAHAASTVECMDCHGLVGNMDHMANPMSLPYSYGSPCERCHYGGLVGPEYAFVAGGFNLTKRAGNIDSWKFDPAEDTGEHAAHMQFVLDAMENDLMEGANEACIGCHTSIPVKITWTHANNLEFNASYDSGLVLPPTHFNTSDYKANGTVVVTTYGNASGGGSVGGWPEGNVTIWD
jgi:nitrate/TMAO reductase-like tetraheme cytochrome c subunit